MHENEFKLKKKQVFFYLISKSSGIHRNTTEDFNKFQEGPGRLSHDED